MSTSSLSQGISSEYGALHLKTLLELDELIYRRSTLSTHEILEKLHSIEQLSGAAVLPARYYQNSIDVCAHRGDIESATLVLRLAGMPISHHVLILSSFVLPPFSPSHLDINMHTGRSQITKDNSPYHDLLWYTITKFTAYGYFDLTSSLWKSALECDPKTLRENVSLVIEKIFTKQYLNPVDSFDKILDICRVNGLHENSQYYQAISNTMDRYLTRRLHEKKPPNVQTEYLRLQALANEKQNYSFEDDNPSLHLFKSRFLLGLCSLSRIQTTIDVAKIQNFFQEATDEFYRAMKLSPSKELQTDVLRSDTGDVVTETLERKPKYNLGKTKIEHELIEIFHSELKNLTNYLSAQNSSDMLKQPMPTLTPAHAQLLRQNLPHAGAEGGNYRMNFEVETHRSVMTHLMNEIPRHVQSVDPIFDQLQSYLARFYSHLLPEKTSRPSPSLIPLPYSDDEITTPPVHSHILLRNLYSLARAHSQRLDTSTTRPINPLKTSDQFYLRNLFNQVIFNARYLRLHMQPSYQYDAEHSDSDFHDEIEEEEVSGENPSYQSQSSHLSDPSYVISSDEYAPYFEILENYGERLIDLADRCGVKLDGYFYANWILSFPLCKLDNSHPTPWKFTSTKYVKRIVLRAIDEIQRSPHSTSWKQKQIDVINHALICHICSYSDAEAIDYAYTTAREMYQTSSGSQTIPVDIWNTLLTTGANNCPGRYVYQLILEAQSECANYLQVPPCKHHDAYVELLQRTEEAANQLASFEEEEIQDHELHEDISQETLISIVQSKFPPADGSQQLQQLQFDSHLAKALLLGHFLTKNKYSSLALMKSLQYHGYRSPVRLYRKLIQCMVFEKADSTDPLEKFLSKNPQIVAPVIHEMMCRDGIRFDATVLSYLGELFIPTRQLDIAKSFLLDCCITNGVAPNEQFLKTFVSICGDENADLLNTTILSFINSYNDRLLQDAMSPNKAPYIPTLAVLKLLSPSGQLVDEDGTTMSSILEKWIVLWAEHESSTNFEEVIRHFSERFAILPSPKSLKKLLAKEIKSRNSVAANRVGSLYLYVYHELQKKSSTTPSSPPSSQEMVRTSSSLQQVHEELRVLFEGYEIPFTISMKGETR